MKLKACLTIFILSLSYIGFGQNFKAEKLIGNWDCKREKGIQTYTFVDASHLLIYNNATKNGNPIASPRRYRLEDITASTFTLILSLEGDTDKSHESKNKCNWINDNQFKTAPAEKIMDVALKAVFTRKK
jgi:hypothetical protein